MPERMRDILPQVYDELRRLARRQLKGESLGHTLNTTALVHEAWLRLGRNENETWVDHGHFLAIASTAMRRVLVEHARRHHAIKRGGTQQRVPLDDIAALAPDERNDLLVALDEALDRLATLDARKARVVECRFFGGLTEEETAESLGIGLRTAKREWAKARSWLYQALYPDDLG